MYYTHHPLLSSLPSSLYSDVLCAIPTIICFHLIKLNQPLLSSVPSPPSCLWCPLCYTNYSLLALCHPHHHDYDLLCAILTIPCHPLLSSVPCPPTCPFSCSLLTILCYLLCHPHHPLLSSVPSPMFCAVSGAILFGLLCNPHHSASGVLCSIPPILCCPLCHPQHPVLSSVPSPHSPDDLCAIDNILLKMSSLPYPPFFAGSVPSSPS